MKANVRIGDVPFGLLCILLGVLITCLTYGFIFVLAYVLITPLQGPTYWAHVAGTLYVITATLGVLRSPDDYWTNLRWEAKARMSRLQATASPGPGDTPGISSKARLWVMILASFLVPGPQYIVNGAREIAGRRKKGQVSPA